MSKSKSPSPPVIASTPTVSRETLEDTTLRTLKLLRAIGTSLAFRAALASRGYTDADRSEGWSLLHAASGYAPVGPSFDEVDASVRDAIRELDAWDEDGFRVVRATLDRRYPAIAASVLDGIGPSTGPAAIVGVATLLDRLDALEKTKTADARGAIALLAKRGLPAEERDRLRALVAQAQSAPAIDGAAVAADAASRKAAEDAHVAALTALRAWYDEWADIARASVKRRDYLILAGLAKRKAPRAPTTPPAKPPTAGAAS